MAMDRDDFLRFWLGGENDGGGGGGENDGGGGGGGRGTGGLRSAAPLSLIPGQLPGWTDFDRPVAGSALPWFAPGAIFPEDGWDPAIVVDEIALEFARRTDWSLAKKLGGKVDPGEPHEVRKVELDAITESTVEEHLLLLDLGDLLLLEKDLTRSSRTLEIVHQANNILIYFMKLASCSSEVRRETYFLLQLCLRVASIVVRHYKRVYKRARPAQVYPALETLIPTPRHASYPSGHALQAHLMAVALAEIAPALMHQATQLAERIAINREVAGVHFRSDSMASKQMAVEVWTLLKKVSGVAGRVENAIKVDFGNDKLASQVTQEMWDKVVASFSDKKDRPAQPPVGQPPAAA